MAKFIIKYAHVMSQIKIKYTFNVFLTDFLRFPKVNFPQNMAFCHQTNGSLNSSAGLHSSVFSVRPLTFIFWLASVCFTGEKCLMILGRQIHIVVSEGFLALGPGEALVLRPPEQIKGVSPNLTF